MKKIIRLTLLILFGTAVQNYCQSTSFTNIVTSLTIKDIISNTVVVCWRSDQASGVFSIYYNKKQVIKDKFVLRGSELVLRTNIQGEAFGSYYKYEQKITLPDSGEYYFAVTIQNDSQIDNIARGLMDFTPTNIDYKLIPAINTTVQPILIKLKPASFVQQRSADMYMPYYGYLITSLNLNSTEDIFHLKWSVYPKDLKEYIFIIYRSKYPITQYTSPEGLPEYARVTNQFFFEDRNISFETPYYYAVVPDKSKQWNIGINLFDKPAVLVKEAPNFNLKPMVEYIKKKEPLPFKRSEVLSEEDIELAVQQTLSNLQVMPTYREASRSVTEVLEMPINVRTPKPLTAEELTNLSLLSNQFNISSDLDMLQMQDNQPKLQQIDSYAAAEIGNMTRAVLEARNNSIKAQEELERQILNEEFQDYKNLINKVSELNKPIMLFKDLEYKLLVSERLSDNDFKKRLTEYFNQRDRIRILQFQVSNFVKKRESRESRESDFLKKITEIQEQELKNIQRITKLSSIVSDISHKTYQLDVNNVEGSFSLGTAYPVSKTAKSGRPDKNDYDVIYFDLKNSNTYKTFEIPKKDTPKKRLEKVREYYQDFPVEKIPDIYEIPSENWIIVKEKWLNENKDIWSEKQDYWLEQARKILGNDYDRISSKWLKPSPDLALSEGRKALNAGRFQEALYLFTFVSKESSNNLMLLGKSYYELGAYREAFSVFITAYKMGIPDSRYWLEMTSEKILDRKIYEKN